MKPSKPWRVYGARGISTDHRSERTAYEDVQTILRSGVKVTVYHWENGGWRLYERIDPAKEPWQVADSTADARTQTPGTPGTREALRDAQEAEK